MSAPTASVTTLSEYQAEARRTIRRELTDDQRLLDAAAGLAEEAGEVLAHVRKHLLQGRPLDRESLTLELGDALWCVVPSNDPDDPIAAGAAYTTTTPVGSFLLGDTYYTDDFGFTSAAAAIVAGICARILAANPDLTSREVREVIAASCLRIDEAGGSYDDRGHSPFYGFGRVDVSAVILPNQKNAATSV